MRYFWTPFPFPQSPPITGWADIDPLFGNHFTLGDGRVVHRGEKIPVLEKASDLPGVLRQRPQFCGDLIPVSAHGTSLASLLAKKDWDAIRKPLIEERSNSCEACGRRQKSGLNAHEIWEYHLPEHGSHGIQRLAQIKILCHQCHMMFHLAFANLQGKWDETVDRLMRLHRWDEDRFEAFGRFVEARRDTFNRYSWVLDLSIVQSVDTLHLDKVWSLHPELDRVICAPGKYEGQGTRYAAILGKPWVIADRQFPAYPSPLQVAA
ncbi:hypothetical protein HFU84_08520 [Acidithiobacillus sp. CV18-2]|nr:hypothetical protein [Acidithiobacillus sp. CV18-3]MBU2756935.1 hypothetical protein [Acidithiobacillus sp. BN09-2]MBU2777546.1 hypothetical protein [Acidithiobacillus sp. CV18-2]MBU2799646.1 hypothetical protein [Acidithiobacillus sp. VAN18-4]